MSELLKQSTNRNLRLKTTAALLAGGVLTSALGGCYRTGGAMPSSALAEHTTQKPQYQCTKLFPDTTTNQPNTVKIKVTVPESSKADFIGAKVDFHDGMGAMRVSPVPNTNESSQITYQFPTSGTHPVDASVLFEVDGVLREISGENCHADVTVTSTFND